MQQIDNRAPCLNCGSKDSEHWATARDVEYRTSDDDFEYRRCGSCDVVFITDPPRDRLGEIYPSNYYSYTSGEPSLIDRVKHSLDRRALRCVAAGIPGDSLRVLDVGGGVGMMADAMRAADPRVRSTAVVDLDETARDEAERRGHDFVRSRIEDFSAGDAKFDVILAYNLIEHVDAPREVLHAFRSLITPEGRVVIKTPNIDSLDARLFRHRSWGGLHCPRHWVLFNEASLRAACESAGFDVQQFSYTQGAPFWAVSLVSAAESRRLVRRAQRTPIAELRSYRAALAVAAPLDLVRAKVAKTSQVVTVLKPRAEP